jgi:DNA-binding NarL/FixJ family response regulator
MIVDDHPAMRAGLTTVLEAEPDLEPVGAAAGTFDARPMYEERRPDVVLVDFHIPGQSSLRLTQHLKARPLPPRVLVYSAHAGPTLALATALAGGDGLVSKGADARELVAGIRMAETGEPLLPGPTELLHVAADHLGAADLPLAALILHGSSADEIASLHGVDRKTVGRQIARMLDALEPEPAAA